MAEIQVSSGITINRITRVGDIGEPGYSVYGEDLPACKNRNVHDPWHGATQGNNVAYAMPRSCYITESVYNYLTPEERENVRSYVRGIVADSYWKNGTCPYYPHTPSPVYSVSTARPMPLPRPDMDIIDVRVNETAEEGTEQKVHIKWEDHGTEYVWFSTSIFINGVEYIGRSDGDAMVLNGGRTYTVFAGAFTMPDHDITGEAQLKGRYEDSDEMFECDREAFTIKAKMDIQPEPEPEPEPKPEPEPDPFVCNDGELRGAVVCENGQVIYTEICRNNKWQSTGDKCPEPEPEPEPEPDTKWDMIILVIVIGILFYFLATRS